MSEDLPCMHCQRPVPSAEAKFFGGDDGASVFVCPMCYGLAERLYERSKQDLKRLLVMLKEAIRIGLVEGKLLNIDPAKEISKTDLLRTIVELEERATTARGGAVGTGSQSKA